MLDRWGEADHYELYMGRWSRLVAERFLDWLAPGTGLSWLDVGCGTGALTHAIGERSPRLVLGADRSHDFARASRQARAAPGEAYVVADAQELPIAGEALDFAVSALALNFLPQPGRMVVEMGRVLCPGGRAALYVWDYAGGMEFLRLFWDAVLELEPTAAALDEGQRFSICSAPALEQLFVRAGLENIAVTPIDIRTWFRDFESYWSPFLGGQGPAPGYVSKLGEKARTELRDLLRKRLPHNADQSIELTARAWAVQGRRIGNSAP